MKKILILLLSISLLLVSCINESDEKIIKKLEKNLDKYNGYTTEIDMRTIMDNQENYYKMIENYEMGNKYSLKIIEPEESKDIIIEYKDEKILLKHASIDQSFALTNVKAFNTGLLLGSFLFNLGLIKSIDIEEIDDIVYYVLNYNVEDKNKYTDQVKIWLQKKDLIPHMLNIIDKGNNPRIIIKYNNFKFNN